MAKISLALAGAQADQLTALIDGGAGPGRCKIYDENGAGIPADLSVAITTQLLLADIALNDPSFAGFVDAAPGAQIVLDVTPEPKDTEANASATGTPTLFARLEDSSGVEHFQFDTVATSGAELNINSLAIVVGATVTIIGGSITQAESN
jgi:hypothetical protein